jgi:putative nucleotidyltransferase with HDIG domain
MFGASPKRSRVLRTSAVRGPETPWSRLTERLKDRGTLLRLAMCLLAMFFLLAAVQSWKAPFPYRVGYHASHGIAAKLDFERVDVETTNQMRSRAERDVPLVYRNHPEKLDPLPQQLKAHLGDVAQSMSVDDLSPGVVEAFGLAPLNPTGKERPQLDLFATTDYAGRYAVLKQALAAPEMTSTQRKIEDIADEFEKFISPLRRAGVVDLTAKVREGRRILEGSRVRVVDAATGETVVDDALLSKVQLSQQLNDVGDLGSKWLSFPFLDPIKAPLAYWMMKNVPATLEFDPTADAIARSAAKNAVPEYKQTFLRGDLLVQPGETVDDQQLLLLRDEYAAAEALIAPTERIERTVVVFLLIAMLAVLNGYYILHNEPRLVHSAGRMAVYLVAVTASAALARALSYLSWPAEVIPLIAIAMVMTVAYNQVFATMTAFTVCTVVTLSTTSELSQFIALMSTSAMAVVPLNRVASRSKLVVVGLYAATTYLCVRMCIGIIQTQSLTDVFHDWTLIEQSAKGAALCLSAGFIVSGSLPFMESLFGVVTDISLLELSDPSHPLLQELVQRAPGTYNHSIAVGTIAETAADRIGANGLLVRVGAYFHDIGKMLKPQYFVENMQTGAENRHTHLAPAMSTLIIIGHVKDGMDLAEQHNLPRVITDFIEQHHGTTLVEYFYHEAAKLAECQPDHKSDAEESAFRYPGPKPQTREAGVLMLSDAVESASRTLSDPTPKRIETLVHGLTLKRLLDGQFDESSLKLSEIRAVEESLVKSLIGIYHGRIRYPDAQAQTA